MGLEGVYVALMPVYHLTIHAFGSWQEDHPKGYVQRGSGLKLPSGSLDAARRGLQKQAAVRFESEWYSLLREELVQVAERYGVRLHGLAVTPTHLHVVLSFRSPACACGALDNRHCGKSCEAYRYAAGFATRFKRNAGMALRRESGRDGLKWFSRGWHLSRVRDREHLAQLLDVYLPEHRGQVGAVWIEEELNG